jgi:hypothetical protein
MSAKVTLDGPDAPPATIVETSIRITSTRYRWSMSRDSMLHEQRGEGGPDQLDGGGTGRALEGLARSTRSATSSSSVAAMC